MKIDHLGIAVRSVGDSLAFYREALGLELAGTETVEDQGAHVAMLRVGESRIELLEPVSEDTVIGRFIARRGEGLHHVCYEVDDLVASLDNLKSRGVRVLEGYPRPGAGGNLVAFLHPAAANGVLVELVQKVRDQKENR
ncbi:MAG TPA: methylmalonyl-CoA epimerase [Blastocatellia bacterium]|jgi:methylmalonyl-CoA/ethylmalonyl-CoA epimerase|nr:methylmalonyl-CoA epimerase [Blastocatellia bacterium]